MTAYILRRLSLFVIVMWGVASLTFLVTTVTGDPITLMFEFESNKEEIAQVKKAYGLDRPLYEQYANYIWNAAHGDFGISFRQREPALSLVLARLPNTIILCLAAVLISVVFAIPIGTIAAIKQGTLYDGLAMLFALFGQAMPNFWLAIMLILVFGLSLGWLPIGGTGGLKNLILPAIAMAAYPVARNARLIRSSMIEVLGKEYITTARAKGLGELTVYYRHALRNALIPVVTFVAMDIGFLLGSNIVVEEIFSWPGLGRLLLESIQQIDYPVIQAGTITVAFVFLTANLAADVAYMFFDPRIRYVK
jgi:peptide/nickel transport system permease protein